MWAGGQTVWLRHQTLSNRSWIVILGVFVFVFNLLHVFLYVHVGALEWRSEDNLRELIFSRGRTEAVRIGCKGVHPLSPPRSSVWFADSRLERSFRLLFPYIPETSSTF